MLEELYFGDFLKFLNELYEELDEEHLWNTYISTRMFEHKSYDEFKTETKERTRMKSMTIEELEEQSEKVLSDIDRFFGKGGHE